MPYVMPKPFTRSRTVQFNAILIAIATFLATINDAAQSPAVAPVVAALPEHWRHVIAAVLGVVGSIGLLLRVITRSPVSPPRIGGR